MKISNPIILPTRYGPLCFRHLKTPEKEGVCITNGENPSAKEHQLLRVQSSCLFSESFGSIDCDCARQLDACLQLVAEQSAVLFYFFEEGRGMGLGFKFESIRLEQQNGLSSSAAYERLGAPLDVRVDYTLVNKVLNELLPGHPGFRLLTNNPVKEQAVRNAGVRICSVRSLVCGVDDPLCAKYLKTKQREFGHHIFD